MVASCYLPRIVLIRQPSTIAGLLKEYLRELPQPVFSGCLYQMLVDAMGVFLPDDPDGNAKLIFSILDCLPKANRVSALQQLCRQLRTHWVDSWVR